MFNRKRGKLINRRFVGKFVLLAVLLLMCVTVCGFLRVSGYAADVSTCTTYSGSNVEDQDYNMWSSPVRSYLSYDNGTYMRFQAGAAAGGYLVEYYDSDFKLTSRKVVANELDIFGGFCQVGNYYYVLSGQKNEDESDSVEVFRVTKYNKNWVKQGSCGLNGANTYIPFDAGSARMAVYGNYLLIRTCHEMYSHHQANVTIQVDMSSMKIVDSFTSVMNVDYGYVSHSFNQFIQMENGCIVGVDHGDANPRSVVLVKYPSAVSASGFRKYGCKATDIISFSGEIGANYTGATVGAFEISSTSYLVAGSRDIGSDSSSGRNIYVAGVSKSTGNITVNEITSYSLGYTETPHMVKTGADSYILLWHRDSSVYYTRINGDGNRVGDIYKMAGDLSDCVPVLAGGKLVWYTWDNENISFYQINVSNLSSNSVTKNVYGHSFVRKSFDAGTGKVTLRCSKCGEEKVLYAITSFETFWKGISNNGFYYPYYESRYQKGESLPFLINYRFSDASKGAVTNSDMTYEISNKDVISVKSSYNGNGKLIFGEAGVSTVVIYPSYNPDLKQSYVFRVGADGEASINNCKITLSKSRYTYTGQECRPSVTVTSGGQLLEQGTDYTVGYTDNKAAGTAQVKITGLGVYGGSVVRTFVIEKAADGTTNSGGTTKPGDTTKPGNTSKPVAKISVGKATITSATNVSTGVALKWKKVAGATGYIVYRRQAGTSSWTRVRTIGNAKTVTYTDKAVKSRQGKRYVYRIVTYKSKNGRTLAKAAGKSVTIIRLGQSNVRVANIKGRKLKAAWTRKSGVTGWQLQYSSNRAFAKGKTRLVTCSANTVSRTIRSLKKNTTYYVRLRSYNRSNGKVTSSAWGKVAKIKIVK